MPSYRNLAAPECPTGNIAPLVDFFEDKIAYWGYDLPADQKRYELHISQIGQLAETPAVYDLIINDLNSFTKEKKIRDAESAVSLENMAKTEIEREDNFLKRISV